MAQTTAERFYAKIDRSPEHGGCWLWTAGINRGGYAKFKVDGRTALAHRWSYEYHVGPIPPGLQIDHVKAWGCTNRHCVNPAHMEPVTCRENLMRGDTIQAANAAKVECPRGHPLSGDNLLVSKGARICRTCKRADHRRWRAAHLDQVRIDDAARHRAARRAARRLTA